MIEYQCLVAALLIAGVLLAPRHPAFLLLSVMGLGLGLYPWFMEKLEAARARSAVGREAEALIAYGFKFDVEMRAQRSEGGARVALDLSTSRLALITRENTRIVGFSELKEVVLSSYSVSQWGKETKTRYGFRLVPAQGDSFGLSFPTLAPARKAYMILQTHLGNHIIYREELR